MRASGLGAKYDKAIDRDSAYERLRAKSERAARDAEEAKADEERREERARDDREFEKASRYDGGSSGRLRDFDAPKRRTTSSRGSDSIGESFAKSFARQLGTKTGQAVIRGVLGSIFGKR
jgi:hypothetical protein